jgi:transcriptional regulator with XRE-family HTH domain
MPDPTSPHEVGKRIAYHRRIARMTQQQLADSAGIHVGTLRKVERGARRAGDAGLDALADALGSDPTRLHQDVDRSEARVHAAMPQLSAILATYEAPEDGPVRPLSELRAAVTTAVGHRLAARYVQLTRTVPALLAALLRGYGSSANADRPEFARLLVSACRSADAVAYKHGAKDLSARLIELMRWAAPAVDEPLLGAAVAYVRAETFFAARAHTAGARMLEQALDAAPAPVGDAAIATQGALHMRTAVIKGRAGDGEGASGHMADARRLADQVAEGSYLGTAFGPHSVRIHEVSLAVSLGDAHAHRALDIAREWAPPRDTPAERRSGFYIELARAQLWAGQPHHAFESMKVARKIAPQHTREHPWVREDAATLRRLRRADAEDLSHFAEWCQAPQ